MKTTLTLFWTLVVLCCCQTTLASGPMIVAHRGASHDAPENTLAAFRLAWEQGADGIEGDFYLSSDGQVVCTHDKDTERVAGVKHIVAETTFEKLRTLDVGAWKGEKWRGERIPSLEEVIETVPEGKMLFIEFKFGPEIVEPTLHILDESSIKPEQIVFISFNEETIAACEKLRPEMRSHWLTSYKKKKGGPWKPSAEKVAETVRRIGADGLGTKALLEFVDEAFIAKYRELGRDEFHVWTVDDLKTAQAYQKMGALGLTTNRPGWLRKQLEGQ